MPKSIQIRNVSERLHRELTRRAKARGQTLTSYIENLLEREMARPSFEEVTARIRSHGPAALDISGAELVREARAERERQLDRRCR